MLLEDKGYTPHFQISLELSMQENEDRSDSGSEDNFVAAQERFVPVTLKDSDNFLLANINKNTK